MEDASSTAVLAAREAPVPGALTVPKLALRGVSRHFGRFPAVQDVAFDVAPGEIVCLLGPSGCGKSTILRLIAGLEAPDAGIIALDGHDVARRGWSVPPEKRHVGLMFQDFALFPHLSVAANVAFGLRHMRKERRAEIVSARLGDVGLSGAEGKYPHQLSGGEQQRVALARALAPEPAVILMDEPFSGLDSRLRDSVRRTTLATLRARGVTALMVTHDPEEAMEAGDRIVLMRAGRIAQDATPVRLYAAPVDLDAAAFFSDLNCWHGVVTDGSVETGLGPIPADERPDGLPVTVAVRPEHVLLGRDLPGGTEATVQEIHRLGAMSEVVLALSQGGPVRARIWGEAEIAGGEHVQAAVKPGAALLFPRKSG